MKRTLAAIIVAALATQANPPTLDQRVTECERELADIEARILAVETGYAKGEVYPRRVSEWRKLRAVPALG